MDDDKIIAANLAAALLTSDRVKDPGDISPETLAARAYFDCIDALTAERKRRRKAEK